MTLAPSAPSVLIIAALYRAALEPGLEGFAQRILERIGESFGCERGEWWTVNEPQAEPELHGRASIVITAGKGVAGAIAEPITIEFDDVDPNGVRHRFDFQRRGVRGSAAALEPLVRTCCEHAVAAERLARGISIKISQTQAASRGDAGLGLAIVARDGAIQSLTAEFGGYIKRAQADWDERRLPFGFEWQERLSTHGMVWKNLFLRFEPVGEQFRVSVREDRRKPGVSEREFEIATRVARGMTFKEIARDLDLAPSTVSTHLYNLYAKLNISRRAHLVEWLRRSNNNPAL